MSLIGIDIGSSTTKIAAYTAEGTHLATVHEPSIPHHPYPGCWELDPEEIWNNALKGLKNLINNSPVKKDPPVAMAISASTREGFPVDSEGKSLGPCIMTADTRESGIEEAIKSQYSPEEWFSFCGHLPERMDPICRLLWWQKNHPRVMEKARYFLGWAEYLSLKLTGNAVSDKSHAGRYLIYDFKTHQWSPERMSQFKVNPTLLPEIKLWGTLIGPVKKEVSRKIGLKGNLELAVGAIDAYCCLLGAGVSGIGTGGLISGSWENIIIPINVPPPASEIAELGASIGPYPGKLSWAVNAWSPTGNSVLDSVRNLVKLPLKEMEQKLKKSSSNPSPIVAIPHLSGATVPWFKGTKLRGAFFGLTLASKPIDVVKAVMESVVYDLYYTISLLEEKGVTIDALKAIGGGTRSNWWTQLKADVTRIKIKTIDQAEPGTLGAALLAGRALDIFDDPEEKANTVSKTKKTFMPNPQRAALHKERLKFYKSLISEMLGFDWSKMVKL